MREVKQFDYTYSNDNYLSVVAGRCESQTLLLEYLEKDYDFLGDGYIGSEFGIDFGINTYDEDYLVAVVNEKHSSDIRKIFEDAIVFDIDLLEQDYPDGLDGLYNVALIVGKLKYEGKVKELQNDEFGYFKFLGTYPDE